MPVIEVTMNSNMGTAKGLTQWDYGQVMHITWNGSIPDGAEVNFCQKDISSLAYIKDSSVSIPDRLLQNPDAITAYVYVRGETEGETILIIWLPVTRRPRPDHYVLPDTEEYLRLLPGSGAPGQVLTKKSGMDYAAEWGYRADRFDYNDGYMQLMSGDIPIGERVRIMKEEREIELMNDGTVIKWRYTDSNEWHDLVSIRSITGPQGPPGITPEFEIRDGNLIAKYNG